MKYTLNEKQTELVVSILNSLVEGYCKKYPNEYNFDDQSFGYTDEEIMSANGDDLEDSLAWVLEDVIPDLIGK